MVEVLQSLLIAGIVTLAVCVATAAWIRHLLRRRLRIAAAVKSKAPTVWLVSPTATARLHHRLRRVGATADAASTLDPALGDVASELLADALSLESAVVATARTGRNGTWIRRDLSARVAELERVARQLASLSTPAASASGGAVRLHDRVDALAAARQELTDIEFAAGLRTRA